VKGEQDEQEDRLAFYAGILVVIGAAGLVGAAFLTRTPQARMGAFFGVAASLLSGLIALSLKRWALTKSLQWALGMIGASFFVRVVMVLVGLFVVMQRAASETAYMVGFFSVYFALQWVEVSYVLDASKRKDRGGFK